MDNKNKRTDENVCFWMIERWWPRSDYVRLIHNAIPLRLPARSACFCSSVLTERPTGLPTPALLSIIFTISFIRPLPQPPQPPPLPPTPPQPPTATNRRQPPSPPPQPSSCLVHEPCPFTRVASACDRAHYFSFSHFFLPYDSYILRILLQPTFLFTFLFSSHFFPSFLSFLFF